MGRGGRGGRGWNGMVAWWHGMAGRGVCVYATVPALLPHATAALSMCSHPISLLSLFYPCLGVGWDWKDRICLWDLDRPVKKEDSGSSLCLLLEGILCLGRRPA